jgi:dsRNA-specific ribonuclease
MIEFLERNEYCDPSVLGYAFTAPALCANSNYQIYETVGDQLIKVVTTISELFNHPYENEVKLTMRIGDIVSNKRLGMLGREAGLERFLKTNR